MTSKETSLVSPGRDMAAVLDPQPPRESRAAHVGTPTPFPVVGRPPEKHVDWDLMSDDVQALADTVPMSWRGHYATGEWWAA